LIEKAIAALVAVVAVRHAGGEPILKEEATTFLCQEQHLALRAARALLKDEDGRHWNIASIPGKKGRAQALYPCDNEHRRKYDLPETPHEIRAGEEDISVTRMESSDGNATPTEPVKKAVSSGTLFPSPGKSRVTEIDTQNPASNGASRD